MVEHLVDVVALGDITFQHAADEIDTLLAEYKGDAEVAVHNLVDAVKRVLLVDNGVQEDTQSPDVLFCPTIWLSSKNFGSGII